MFWYLFLWGIQEKLKCILFDSFEILLANVTCINKFCYQVFIKLDDLFAMNAG